MTDTGMPFSNLMGVEITVREKDRVVGKLVVREDLCTAGGILHGGTYMAFADALGAIGGALNLAPGTRTTTLESKTNFLGPAKSGDTVIAVCTPIHVGRRTSVWQTKLTTEAGKPIEHTVHYKEGLKVNLVVDIDKPSTDMSVGISFYDEFNNRLFRTSLTDVDKTNRVSLKPGKNKLSVSLPLENLREGAFIVALDCDIYRKDWVHNPYHTPVRTKFFLQSDGSKPPQWDAEREGLTKPIYQWHVG